MDYANSRRIRKYDKHHTQEHDSCMANLFKLIGWLNSGGDFRDAGFGFIHPEGASLHAIGNKRTSSSRETRLYIFVAEQNQTIFVLDIGDKDTQQADIRRCRKTIKELMNKANEQGDR